MPSTLKRAQRFRQKRRIKRKKRRIIRNKLQINREKESSWGNNIFIRALKKMKFVGLKNALKPDKTIFERISWTCVFILCMAYTYWLTAESVTEYSSRPILHSFDEDTPIKDVPFPGTTICPAYLFKNNALALTEEIFAETFDGDPFTDSFGTQWNKDEAEKLLLTLDHVCESSTSFSKRLGALVDEKYTGMQSSAKWFKERNLILKDNPLDSSFRNKIIPFLKTKIASCSDILAVCVWEGEVKNCREIFAPVQTDMGTCCSFNKIPDSILKKSKGLMSLLHTYNFSYSETHAWDNWNIDDTKSVTSSSTYAKSDAFEYPRHQDVAGQAKGLSIFIRFEETKSLSCPTIDSNGFMIGVHSPMEEPHILKTGVPVPPDQEVFIRVKSELTIADPEIRSLTPERRKCYFQDENPLKKFSNYTVGNCHRECGRKWIFKECKCYQLAMSDGENETICGPVDFECVKNATNTLEKKGYNYYCREPFSPYCHAPCTEIKYEADATYLPYHSLKHFNQTILNASEETKTSIVHVFFGSDTASTRERRLQFGFSFLVGVIGGIWGMTFEFSIATVFNILAGLVVLITPICPCLVFFTGSHKNDWQELEEEDINDNPNPDNPVNQLPDDLNPPDLNEADLSQNPEPEPIPVLEELELQLNDESVIEEVLLSRQGSGSSKGSTQLDIPCDSSIEVDSDLHENIMDEVYAQDTIAISEDNENIMDEVYDEDTIAISEDNESMKVTSTVDDNNTQGTEVDLVETEEDIVDWDVLIDELLEVVTL